MRPIDADALIADIKRAACTDCNSYNGVRCRACWADDAMDMADDALDLSLNTLRDAIYEDAVAHGLWEDYDQKQKRDAEFCARYTQYAFDQDSTGRNECALCVCRECIELREARDDADAFAEELADVIIMSMSVAGKLGIDIDAAIRRKMEINKQRPWKHGKTE